MGCICRLRRPGGWPGQERGSEDYLAWHGLPSQPPAGHAPGLARQVIESELENLEPPAEALRH